MASMKILCRKVLEPLMEPYGFFRCSIGNGRFLESYYRQVNDVVQVLSFLKRGKKYSFAFDIYPLSLGINHLEVDLYDITLQRGEWSEWIRRNRPWECWNYRTAWRQWWAEDELTDTDFEEPIKIIKEEIIPIFEKGNDARSSYEQLTAYEQTFFSGIIMHSTSLLLLSLQAGDYETAQRHMEAICAQNGLEECRLKLDRIKNRDTAYWDKVLTEGTEKTLDFLESIKPKRRTKR